MTAYSLLAGLAMSLLPFALQATPAEDRGAVSCEDLSWSAEVLAANPDIGLACRGVYEKDGNLYARATIEVVKVQAGTLFFRTLRTDGSKGPQRRVKLPASWRASIQGREYRLADMVAGQKLDIYLPENRFALFMPGADEAQGVGAARIE